MAIDPNIPLQARGVQLESPANQLNMMASAAQLSEYQRGVGEKNALRDLMASGVDIKSPEAIQKIYAISPEMGMNFEKRQAELNKNAMEGKKLGLDVEGKKLDLMREAVASLSFNPSDENITAFLQDSLLKGYITKDQAEQQLTQYRSVPINQRPAFFTDLGLKAEARVQNEISRRAQNMTAGTAANRLEFDRDKLNRGEFTPPIEMNGPNGLGYYVVNKNNPSDVRMVGAGENIPSSVDVGEMIPGDPAVVNALRAPSGVTSAAQPNVNALTASPAAMPQPANAPFTKPETAAAREKQAKAEKGQQNVDQIIGKMFKSYEQLNKAKAIPNSKNTTLQNIQSYGAASMPQIGRAVGSKEQGIRDTITQIRPALIQGIKNATGMSAQEMNSNVELQIQLEAASDPALSIDSNIAALNNISKLYGLGAEYKIPGVGGVPETPQNSVPPDAIEYLRANPNLAADFEAEFNLPAGSAQQYLGGGNGR